MVDLKAFRPSLPFEIEMCLFLAEKRRKHLSWLTGPVERRVLFGDSSSGHGPLNQWEFWALSIEFDIVIAILVTMT